mmetsp:Transcript_3082/g.3548  ORF Transcript_3082/g.3548 Transcript_3082/m.3548 type:complete len:432 (-) Transcript_3082:169-1464(-)
MNSFPHYLLSLLWLFVIGGGITSASASASASFKVDHQQQQHLRGLLQQHNTKNFASVNNESSRRLSIELEHESAIEQLELERQPRIIGGAVVTNPATRYPYFALMSGRALCGAVLIAPGFVITAAHCAYADTDFQLSGTGTIEYDYASGRIHPDYNEENVSHDIALFELSQIVPSSSVTPVKLRQTPLPSTSTAATQSLTVLGFGDTDPSESVSETSTYLREVDLNYVSEDQCSRSFGGSWWGGGIGIGDGMLCAYNSGKDSCGGDSGGPLLLKSSSGRASDDELVGLVSWGISCADDGYPGVYTRVSYYYEWIVETMCELNPNPSGLPDGVVCDSGGSSSSSGSSNTGDGDVGDGDDCTYEGVSRSAGEYLTGSTLTCLCTSTGEWIECLPNADTDDDDDDDDDDDYSLSSESSFYDDPLGWISELFGLI